MNGRIRKVFPGGNTSQGFRSFFQYIIDENAERIFIIKGGPGVGKSTFMSHIGREMGILGFDIEEHHCSSDPVSLDALVIPAVKVALLDGTAPHVVDPKNPGLVEEIINLGDYWNDSKIQSYKDEIMKINRRVGRLFDIAHRQLYESKVAYDEWKSYYQESIDKVKYMQLVRSLLDDVFGNVVSNYQEAPKERHLFASAITPEGLWNYIDTLIMPNMKIFALKGSPGTGVKAAIGRVSQAASELGLDTEQFHCPIEPEFLDMVIIPGLNTAVMNVTEPYHFKVDQLKGLEVKVIDFNSCIRKEILEDYSSEICDAKGRFHSLLKKSIEHLSQVKTTREVLESYYTGAMDFDKIEAKRQEIVKRILGYVKGV